MKLSLLVLLAVPLACSSPPTVAVPSMFGPFELAACDGRYTLQTTVGSQSFSLLFDTGSAELGVASAACDGSCAGSSLYQPGSTSTDMMQTMSASYGGATSTFSGEVYTDTAHITDMVAGVSMTFIGMSHQSGLLSPPGAACTGWTIDGILGAGPQVASDGGTDALMPKLAAANPALGTFTFQLCPSGGTLWFGGDGLTAAAGPMQYTPMLTGPLGVFGYSFAVDDLKLEGASDDADVGAIDGGLTIDTGAQEGLVLIPAAFGPLTSALTNLRSFQTLVSSDPTFFASGACAPPSTADLNAELPWLTFTVPSATGGSTTLRVPPVGGYLRQTAEQICPNVSETLDFNIMGVGALSAFVVRVDTGGGQVGFAPQGPCK